MTRIANHLLLPEIQYQYNCALFRSFHLLFYWVLFENVMSFHRTKATFIGLFEAKRVNEWVVTEKLGDTLKNKSNSKSARKSLSKLLGDR